MVSQHCDFGPWNILIGKTFVYLTDFGNYMTGFPAYDAAFFHTSLDLFTRYKTVDKSLVRKMQASFLNAFISHHSFTQDLRPVPSLFEAFCVIHLKRFVLSICAI
jgi:Ser/Thr protein kinase RdoA (MazF antagonist)